jgi:hypothetical protein
MNSPGMAKQWPGSLREKAAGYFSAAPVINELLISNSIRGRYKNIEYLHFCIHNPLLANYLPLVLGSDYDAQKIIAAVKEEHPGQPVETPATYIHLASAALWGRQYLRAEHYLRLRVEYLSGKNWLDDYSNFNYCTLRMYLLFIGGEKARATQVSREYLDFLEKKKGNAARDKMGIQLDKYLNWLEQTLKPKEL